MEDMHAYDDMREACKMAFNMEQVYKFNLDNCIQYYDYDECDKDDDEEENVLPQQVKDSLDGFEKLFSRQKNNRFAKELTDSHKSVQDTFYKEPLASSS